jgi:thymidine phosphorylase
VVTAIDNLQMARIARMAGAPMDKGAGVDLMKKLGEEVVAGDILYRVHAEFPSDFDFAREACSRNTGYRIGKAEDIPASFVDF